jgi:hypothetical protein
MTPRSASSDIEFIRLNGQAVRVTSWTEPSPGSYRLVAIVRGSGEARSLADLLGETQLVLELPGEDPRPVSIASLDRRESGTPPAVITRFAVDFASGSDTAAAPQLSVEERVAALEQEVATLRTLIRAIANDSGSR